MRKLWILILAVSGMTPGVASSEAISYVYDALGRLKAVSYSTGAEVLYDYDAVGNRITVTASGDPIVEGGEDVRLIYISTPSGPIIIIVPEE